MTHGKGRRAEIYLDPTGAHRAAQQVGQSSGDALLVGERTLGRRLRERGLLRSTEPERHRLTVRRALAGQAQRAVWHMSRAFLSGGMAEVAVTAIEPATDPLSYSPLAAACPLPMATSCAEGSASGHQLQPPSGHQDSLSEYAARSDVAANGHDGHSGHSTEVREHPGAAAQIGPDDPLDLDDDDRLADDARQIVNSSRQAGPRMWRKQILSAISAAHDRRSRGITP